MKYGTLFYTFSLAGAGAAPPYCWMVVVELVWNTKICTKANWPDNAANKKARLLNGQ
jgi:hypothetical protein